MRRLAASFFLSCSALLACAPALAHHAPGPIRIAAILSTSGPGAEVGGPQLKALQLAVEQLNRDGGLLTHAVALEAADDATDATKAEALARQLAVPEKADILIGGSVTSTALAIVPVAQAARIPFIALATGSRTTERMRGWVFRTPPTESMAILRILEDVAASGGKRIAALTMDTESGRTARRDLQAHTDHASIFFRKAGIDLAADVAFAPNDAAAAAQALARAARAKDIDAIVAVAYGEPALAISRQHRDSGSKARLYLSHAAATPEFIAGAAGIGGLRLVVPPLMVRDLLTDADPQKAVIRAFVDAYSARFGAAPPPAAGYAADAMMLAAQAIRTAKSLDFEMMRQGLDATRNAVGVTGTFTYWSSDHRSHDPKSLRLVEVTPAGLKLLD